MPTPKGGAFVFRGGKESIVELLLISAWIQSVVDMDNVFLEENVFVKRDIKEKHVLIVSWKFFLPRKTAKCSKTLFKVVIDCFLVKYKSLLTSTK